MNNIYKYKDLIVAVDRGLIQYGLVKHVNENKKTIIYCPIYPSVTKQLSKESLVSKWKPCTKIAKTTMDEIDAEVLTEAYNHLMDLL